MNSLSFSKILTLAFIVFLAITFWNGYAFLLFTRIALLIFALITFLIERKKKTVPIRKFAFIRFGLISLVLVLITLFIDAQKDGFPYFSRQLLMPLYMISMLGILYVEMYGIKPNKKNPSAQS